MKLQYFFIIMTTISLDLYGNATKPVNLTATTTSVSPLATTTTTTSTTKAVAPTPTTPTTPPASTTPTSPTPTTPVPTTTTPAVTPTTPPAATATTPVTTTPTPTSATTTTPAATTPATTTPVTPTETSTAAPAPVTPATTSGSTTPAPADTPAVPTPTVDVQQTLISVYIQNNYEQQATLTRLEFIFGSNSTPTVKDNLNIKIKGSTLYSKGTLTAFDITTANQSVDNFSGIKSITINGDQIVFANIKTGSTLSRPIKITKKNGHWILDK